MTGLEGRDVVVTGGTGELGAAVVEMLLGAGATVHAPCRDAARAGRISKLQGGRLRLIGGVDLGDETAVRALYSDVPALWGSVHAAGGFAAAKVEATSLAEFDGQIAINTRTAFLCCREAIVAMRRAAAKGRPGGRIVNVAAMPALEPRRGAGMAAYTASKAAVAALTQALAEEVASEGIFVNAVVPSILDTEANRKAMPTADFTRWVRLDDAARTIAFLVSPDNAATRGALATVYGRG